jgi:hypothetical protein
MSAALTLNDIRKNIVGKFIFNVYSPLQKPDYLNRLVLWPGKTIKFKCRKT